MAGLDPRLPNSIKPFFEKLVSNAGPNVKGHCAVIADIIISYTQWCL